MIKASALLDELLAIKYLFFEFHIDLCQFRLANKNVKPKNILSILRRTFCTYEGYTHIRNGRCNENGESNQA